MKRIWLARALRGSGALSALLAWRKVARSPLLPVLTYHRVAEPDAGAGLYPHTIDATPRAFERQVAFLTRHFHFVSVEQVLAATRGAPLPPNPVLLTFDDGYRECFSTVLPILQRHGAVATFFIATSYVGERRLFWWDRIFHLISRTRRQRLELRYPEPMGCDIRGDGHEAAGVLVKLVKERAGLDVERFLDHLAEAADVPFDRGTERRLADRVVMDWSEVEALAAAGMDIQSHTCSHRVLETLSPAELERELCESREQIERRVRCPVEAIAYPVGTPIGSRVREALRGAGYRLGFTNQTGVNHLRRFGDAYGVRRISMSASYPDVLFRTIMVLPELAPAARRRAQPAGGAEGVAVYEGDNRSAHSPRRSATRSRA